jgi:hypothetical protein
MLKSMVFFYQHVIVLCSNQINVGTVRKFVVKMNMK